MSMLRSTIAPLAFVSSRGKTTTGAPRLIVGALACVAVLLASATTVSAHDSRAKHRRHGEHVFQPLSTGHIRYGVAQFNYTQLPGNLAMKLLNPNRIRQIAAAFVYSRHLEGGPRPDTNPTAVYQGCLVRSLGPHGALTIDSDLIPRDDAGGILDKPERSYVEVIWAPETPVRVGGHRHHRLTRIADGLGGATIAAGNDDNTMAFAAHPSLFSLPDDAAVDGQREAAIACACDGLAAIDPALLGAFEEFGIACGAPPPP